MIEAFVKKYFPAAVCESRWIISPGSPSQYVWQVKSGETILGTGINQDSAWTAAATYCMVKRKQDEKQGLK
jgi:hypothetical protein